MNRYLVQLGDLAWPNVLIASAVIGALYFFMMFDSGTAIEEQIEQARVQLAESERQLQQTEKAMADANRFEAEVQAIQRQFERITDFMPDSMSPAQLISVVTSQAQLAGVTVQSTSPAGTATPEPFYSTAKLRVDIDGTFSQLVTFLSVLSRVPNLMTFEDVAIKRATGAPAGPVSSESGASLKFTGVLVGYKYIKAQSPADAASASAGGR